MSIDNGNEKTAVPLLDVGGSNPVQIVNRRISPENTKHEIFSCVKLSGFDKVCAVLAELIGTALLVFIGCMSCQSTLEGERPLIHIALAFGLALMVNVCMFDHISGAHFNPPVTLAAIIFKKVDIVLGIAYIVAQTLGGVIGYGVLTFVSTHEIMFPKGDDAKGLCVTEPHASIGVFNAFIIETIGTAVLCGVICSFWDPRNKRNTDSIPLRVGLTVTVLAIITGPYTGASLNPARSFGPAVFSGNWKDHWVYWVAPNLGGVIAGLVSRYVFYRQPELFD